MQQLDLVTRLFLLFGNEYTYLLIILIGLLTPKAQTFKHIIVLLMFTMIYNLWLKSLWQVPLPETVGHPGWAFPSGHMHASTIFWGMLAIHINKTWLRALVPLILGLHGFALVNAGFHYVPDVFASVAFGCVSLLIYHYALRLDAFAKNPALLGIMLSFSGLVLIWLIPAQAHYPYIWRAIGVLTSFSLIWAYLIQIKRQSFAV